ncbi:MAG: hypothetical protein GKR96_00400 [Gammaproteobacteria bacterium]|nr:hypothetical protein [Gammaproteobacteria bacterium]
MKWVAALLMVVNVAIYLSVGSRHADIDQSVSGDSVDVNIEGMLLLNESPKSPSDLQEGRLSEQNITPFTQDEISVEGGAENLLPSLLDSEIACYRIGPFKSKDALGLAAVWMDGQGFAFKEKESQSRQLKATRVYLGPFDGAASAVPTVNQLNVSGLDHFMYKGDDGLTRISLGYFTQEGLAEKFLSYLVSVDIEAKSLPEYRQLGPFHWLEAKMKEGTEVVIETESWLGKGSSISRMECV